MMHPKMTAIPYGVMYRNLGSFIRVAAAGSCSKTNILANLHLSPTHPERAYLIYPHAVRQAPIDYYRPMKQSEYVISPQGDRPECYRHWEAIGLGAVPICNCPPVYKQLFEDNMMFSNVTEMQDMIRNPKSLQRGKHRYLNPDVLSVGFWAQRMGRKMIEIGG